MTGVEHDPVNAQSHYTSTRFPIECHEIVKYMSFDLGNAVKYLWRRDGKGSHDQDVAKARVYLGWAIDSREPLYVSPGAAVLVRTHLAPTYVDPYLDPNDPLDRAMHSALRGYPLLASNAIDAWASTL